MLPIKIEHATTPTTITKEMKELHNKMILTITKCTTITKEYFEQLDTITPYN